jgi:sulfur carrier protein
LLFFDRVSSPLGLPYNSGLSECKSATKARLVEIYFNGQPQIVPPGTSIAGLLSQLEIQPRQVAVEVNLELVPRTRHAEHLLAAGDRLEVVTLVGGG